jgi:hypothetical protein
MTTFTTEDRLQAQHETPLSSNTFSSTAVFQALPDGLDPIPYEEKYKDLLRSSS